MSDDIAAYDDWFAEVALRVSVTAGINAMDIAAAPYETLHRGRMPARLAAVLALNLALADGLITGDDVRYYAAFSGQAGSGTE